MGIYTSYEWIYEVHFKFSEKGEWRDGLHYKTWEALKENSNLPANITKVNSNEWRYNVGSVEFRIQKRMLLL